MRACNDLGYIAAVMRKKNWEILLRDYQTENCEISELFSDMNKFNPDVLFISVTNATLPSDLILCSKIRALHHKIVIILKGAVFFNPPQNLLRIPELQKVDYLIAEEAECIIDSLLDAHFYHPEKLSQIPRILYKQGCEWFSSACQDHFNALDTLPFPARDLMKNELYVRPDTGKPMATISTSRGCPSNCIFCLTPPMSGQKVRTRSPQSIYQELTECVEKYGIREFFFRADTFTINKNNVLSLCQMISNGPLNKKISWVANARATTLDAEMLTAMKKAGCWLIAVGFESGSEETLKKIKKNCSIKHNLTAAKLVHQAKIKLFGFFMIGFPWETEKHLRETEKLIHQTRPDFLELHIATPFYGTEFYHQYFPNSPNPQIIGCDYFQHLSSISQYFNAKELLKIRRKIVLRYLFSIQYLWKRFLEAVLSPTILFNYTKYAFRLINLFMEK